MEAFHHPYGLSMLYSLVFDIVSGCSQKFGHDVGSEGCAFVSYDRLRDVRSFMRVFTTDAGSSFRIGTANR